MTFLAPIMLVGAAAVTIPLALHFFYRARYRPLPWAPMKFLKEAIEQTSRRLKFQEWILLALRCLAIILLALALARPGLRRRRRPGATRPSTPCSSSTRRTAWPPRTATRPGSTAPRRPRCAVIDTLPAQVVGPDLRLLRPRRTARGPDVAVQPRPGEATHPGDRGHQPLDRPLPGLTEASTAAESRHRRGQGDLRLHRHAEDRVRAAAGRGPEPSARRSRRRRTSSSSAAATPSGRSPTSRSPTCNCSPRSRTRGRACRSR